MPQRHFGGCPQIDKESEQCTCEIDGVFCRCIVCREAFPLNKVEGMNKCPQCNTSFKPMSPLDDVTVKVNWWELQIVLTWAEAWANQNVFQSPQMRNVIYATAKQIEEQCPSYNPLTVAGDQARAKEQIDAAITKISSDEVNLHALIARPVVH